MLLVAACSDGGDAAGERLRAGDVVVEIEPGADGRLQACVVSAKQFALPDWPLCVGPHNGTPGPSHAWSSATRSGDNVLALVIMGNGDTMADEWYTTAASSRHPIAVAAGVLRDYGGSVVCGTYVSGGLRYDFDTGVSVASPGGASTDIVACAEQGGPVRLRPWVVHEEVGGVNDDFVSALGGVASFFGDHGIAMRLDPVESVIDERGRPSSWTSRRPLHRVPQCVARSRSRHDSGRSTSSSAATSAPCRRCVSSTACRAKVGQRRASVWLEGWCSSIALLARRSTSA